jgi:hypothetical protein
MLSVLPFAGYPDCVIIVRLGNEMVKTCCSQPAGREIAGNPHRIMRVRDIAATTIGASHGKCQFVKGSPNREARAGFPEQPHRGGIAISDYACETGLPAAQYMPDTAILSFTRTKGALSCESAPSSIAAMALSVREQCRHVLPHQPSSIARKPVTAPS